MITSGECNSEIKSRVETLMTSRGRVVISIFHTLSKARRHVHDPCDFVRFQNFQRTFFSRDSAAGEPFVNLAEEDAGICLRGWYARSSAPFSAPDSSESGGVGSPARPAIVSPFAKGLRGLVDRKELGVVGAEDEGVDAADTVLFSRGRRLPIGGV